ncbi:hypothetical protein [Humibacillus xanthopallidus]|uniref:hypothetical protein n=1 Tax=Humibacillus xanthopallidus TaxID=412689 RepID=UPI0038512B4C
MAVAALAVPAAVLMAPNAFAVSQATLTGSNFQIDDDANLKVDTPTADDPQSIDWGGLTHTGLNPPEIRATDKTTGQTDDSYKGGVKEDTECPGEVTGSIPNNKSDLLTFHFYEEAGVGGHPGFANIAWSRVSDPSGTTLMDFEFNQSKTKCGTGPNVVRTNGDLLIEYAIDQGGARADILGRTWNGSAWSSATALDEGTACGGGPCAVGTINSTVIPDGEADGLGEKQPRTFGEAQIDLRLIFDGTKCVSFGSAMLKSRSSDAFTSQLKDFITPIPIDLTNCDATVVTTPVTSDGTTPIGAGGVLVGSSVRDSAVVTVTGATGQSATGAVKFFICKIATGLCDGTEGRVGTQVGTPATGEPLPGNTNPATVVSDLYSVTEVGRYCFRAEYSGDVEAGIPARTDFAERECFTATSVPSTISTAQNWLPNDAATVSATAGGAMAGTVTFTLYNSTNCAAGTSVYTENRPVAAASPVTVNTTNGTVPATTYVATATGEYSWGVSYTSTNPAQDSIAASCKEVSSLTVDNDNTVS